MRSGQAEAPGRQDEALTQYACEVWQIGIDAQIGALDVWMGNALAAGAEDFVTWTDEMLASTYFNLIGPARLRKQAGNAESMGRERRDFGIEPCDLLFAHEIEANLAAWNCHRM